MSRQVEWNIFTFSSWLLSILIPFSVNFDPLDFLISSIFTSLTQIWPILAQNYLFKILNLVSHEGRKFHETEFLIFRVRA